MDKLTASKHNYCYLEVVAVLRNNGVNVAIFCYYTGLHAPPPRCSKFNVSPINGHVHQFYVTRHGRKSQCSVAVDSITTAAETSDMFTNPTSALIRESASGICASLPADLSARLPVCCPPPPRAALFIDSCD